MVSETFSLIFSQINVLKFKASYCHALFELTTIYLHLFTQIKSTIVFCY